MKKVLFIIGFPCLIFLNSLSQSSWQVVNSPVSENLVSVCFTDLMHGFIVSENATFIKTTDGGTSWQTSFAWPGIYLNDVFFCDTNQGWSVGWFDNGGADSSLILKTVDGGNLWTGTDHLPVNRFNDVFFIDCDKGWAVGSKGEQNLNCIYRTIDGGNTWSEQTSMLIVGAKLMGVSFRNENQGSVCGADGAFFLTHSGGINWSAVITMPVVNFNDIFNFGAVKGCIVGDEGTALYTINNWYQYVETTTNTTENLNAVSGDLATNKLWAVGDNGTIIYTSNYLFGWASQESGTTENLNDVCMINENEGWAVGDNGTILHFSPNVGLDLYVEKPVNSIFPNPTDGILNISLYREEPEIDILIYIGSGRTVFEKEFSNKSHIQLDVGLFPRGVYIMLIKTETGIYHSDILIR